MSKKNDKKKRIKKKKLQSRGLVKIDDRVNYGPLEILRAGNNVIMRNRSSPEQQEEIRLRMAGLNRQTIEDLKRGLKEVQDELKKYDPLEIMHRAGYVALNLLMKGKTESDLSTDENMVLPGIEYLQYLISRTPKNSSVIELDESGWDMIWGRTVDLIKDTHTYLMTRRAVAGKNAEMDELVFQLDSMKLMVRINRHSHFQNQYWKISLEPYENELKRFYGVDSKTIIEGLNRIREYQSRGIMNRHLDTMRSVMLVREQALELGFDISDKEQMIKALKNVKWKKLHQATQKKLQDTFSAELFNITDVAKLPAELMNLLAISPGEEPLFELTGPNNEDLSPISTSSLHYRPFMNVDGEFYTFYHSGFEDKIVDLIEADINAKLGKKRSSAEKKKSDTIEVEAQRLFNRILKPDFSFLNIYYPNPDEQGLTELDGLIGIDDVLYLIEVKSGSFSAGASRGAPLALSRDLKELILEGQRQSERAERYIKSAQVTNFYDHTGTKVVHQIRHEEYRNIFRVIITKEQLGWVGARLAKLSVIDPELSKNMPWHISIDDLWAIGDLFEDKAVEFTHYSQQRLRAANDARLHQTDELDHVALYFAHNFYHEMVRGDSDMHVFHGSYTKSIDEYFMNKEYGEEYKKPEQKLPLEMRSLIDAINDSKFKHRLHVTSLLLSLDSNTRKSVMKHLKKLSLPHGEIRQRSVRVVLGSQDAGLSISECDEASWEDEKLRSAIQMKNYNLPSWFAIRVKKGGGFNVLDLELLKNEQFDEQQIEAARMKLEKDLLSNAKQGTIANNQHCPCGSGERFKKCHGKKH
jgi:hypothetical protein